MKGGWIYMLANRYRGTIYTGVTADIARRAWQHRAGSGSKFAAHYNATRLVYIEAHDRIDVAITREKQLKKWRRGWKIDLIESANPDWRDLYDDLNA